MKPVYIFITFLDNTFNKKLTLNALIKINHSIALYEMILGKNSLTLKRRKTPYNF